MTLDELEAIELTYLTGGPVELIGVLSNFGTNDILVERLWSAAMTATYGPTGLHQSWRNPDGTPTLDAIALLPSVSRGMRSAIATIQDTLNLIRYRLSQA